MEGLPASILQSAQNVKVKLLSMIRGVSTVNYCLTYFQNPLPQQFKRNPLGKGVLGGGKVGEMQEKRVKNHNLTCH